MQPEYPTPQPGPTVDYLDSIAPQQAVRTINPLILWGLIAGALIAVVLIVIGFASGGNSTEKLLARVGATSTNLQKLADSADGHIQSSELRTINTSLELSLANTNRDLEEPLKKKDINVKSTKKNKTVAAVAAEFDEVIERLEDARLNGVYDRTYTREVTYLLETFHNDMEQLYKKSNSKSLKEALETNDNNLAPLLNSLKAFNAD